jgi:NAD(P)-dependent dehydrogenase (short-subunit alcohol dehydrogenase family)
MELDGTTAVVTGAASGIGRALAEALGAAGCRVALADVEGEPLAAAAAATEATGATVLARVTDVADPASVRALADAVDAELGGADILCNNAGVFAGGTTWEIPEADFDWVMGVNFSGILHGIQAFVPGMIERGRAGHVVNTSSVAGLFPGAYSAPYTCAKFAALALTECLAVELAAIGAPIGVTALCPGAVRTNIARSERNRPTAERSAPTDAAAFVTRMLDESVAQGIAPAEAAAMVLDAIRTGRYLLLTGDGYAASLRTRTEDLLAGRLPTLPAFD